MGPPISCGICGIRSIPLLEPASLCCELPIFGSSNEHRLDMEEDDSAFFSIHTMQMFHCHLEILDYYTDYLVMVYPIFPGQFPLVK